MSGNEESEWDQIPSLNLTMDEDYSERLEAKEGRRHDRAEVSELKTALYGDISSLSIRMATAVHGTFDGMILDVSKSGCRIEVSKKLKKEELAKIRFVVDDKIIITKAVVRWVSPKSEGCVAGLEFHGIPSDQEEFLGVICSATKLNKVGKI